MKVLFLFLSLFGLVWAESERQPHYKKAMEKCMGEHQITVKSRDAQHKYYIFHYIYSSMMPSNQTWIKKEEGDNKRISNGQQGPDKEKGPRKPIDNNTTREKEEGHKNLVEMGNDSKFEGSTQFLNEHIEKASGRDAHQAHSNPSNRNILQYHLEFIVDKGGNDPSTDDTANDIGGSGDMGFLGQDERHHGPISGNEHQNQGKDHQDPRDTKNNHSGGRYEADQSGIFNDTNLSKDTLIKVGMKEKVASVIQGIASPSWFPNKSITSNSTVYLDVSMKVKNATSNEPSKEGGYSDTLDNEENASSRLQSHFNVQGKISEDLFGELDHRRNQGNYTSFPVAGEMKAVDENVINYTGMHKKDDNEYAILNWKWDEEKDTDRQTKPYQKVEVRDHIMSSKQTEVADVMKPHKQLGVKDDIINGKSSSHIDVVGISKIHRIGEDVTGKSTSQVENPHFILADKINQSQVITSRKLNGSGVTKLHAKGRSEVILLRGSTSQRSGSHATNQSRKDASEAFIIHGKPSNKTESFHFINIHRKKADKHEKFNRNAHRGKQRDPEMQGESNRRLGVTFQEDNKEVVKGNLGYRKAHRTTGLGTDSSTRKEDDSRPKFSRIKNVLTLAYESPNYKHVAKSQERLSDPLKNDRKLIEPSKKSSRVRNGKHGSTAKRYRGHLGVLKRKRSRHDKKSKSRKSVHVYDRSQSSESEENSRNGSRESYEDYQNDNPDSDQSAESVEENLFSGSNQSDDQSQMKDVYSKEDSKGHRSN